MFGAAAEALRATATSLTTRRDETEEEEEAAAAAASDDDDDADRAHEIETRTRKQVANKQAAMRAAAAENNLLQLPANQVLLCVQCCPTRN